MTIDYLTRLEERVNKLLDEIERLTKENQQMQEQVASFPYDDFEAVKSENQTLKDEQRQLKTRINSILEATEKVLR
ncbi:MAG: cell division protein ZapB [bacterium]|nr:cell division protein ZapB [bacterium]